MVEVVHYSVMKNEVVSFLKPDKPGQILVDATTGEGGHSEWFLRRYPDINVVCLDADEAIMEIAKKRLECVLSHGRACPRELAAWGAGRPVGPGIRGACLFDWQLFERGWIWEAMTG